MRGGRPGVGWYGGAVVVVWWYGFGREIRGDWGGFVLGVLTGFDLGVDWACGDGPWELVGGLLKLGLFLVLDSKVRLVYLLKITRT